jgi:hypothetical protein
MLIQGHFTTIPMGCRDGDFLPPFYRPAVAMPSPFLTRCVAFACVFAFIAPVLADSATHQSFDGPDKVWQLLDPRPGVQLIAHGCVTSDAREGTGSERILVAAPGGESVHFACPVAPSRILDESEVRMWVKSNHPGTMVGARIVLPRSIDPATHLPKTVFIEGSRYDQVDHWQQLSLTDLPKQLAARVRVLRTAPGANIDPHEAYLEAVTIIVPGGPGAATVWTDELVVDGVVATTADDAAPVADSGVVQTAFTSSSNPTAPTPLVQVQNTTLFVAGKPFLPRGIEWNGEPLSFLAERGFNTIWIDHPPTADQTAEAQRADVWFVATPPRPDALAAEGLGRSLDRVLAWHLGTPGDRELDYFRGWAELVRQKDPASHRPILVAPQSDWAPCSKMADVILASRPDCGSLAAADYSQWLDERATLSRPGTSFWATIPTQPSRTAFTQIKALAPRPQLLPMFDERQIESLARTAGMQGCRGFLFASTTPLNAGDDTSRRRALSLESINRSLQLLEPWFTLGKKVGEVTSPKASATILQAERARLLVLDARPIDADSSTKSFSITSANATLVVPGVPESNQVFLLSPASMQPLDSKRVAGGVQITIDRNAGDMVLFTDDTNVLSIYRERVAREGPRAARLLRDLVIAHVKSGVAENQRLVQLGIDCSDYQRAVGAANSQIARSDAVLNRGNVQEACRTASATFIALAQAADQQHQKLTPAAPLTSFPPADGDNIAGQIEFQKSLESLRPGANLLTGGEFEDLGELMQLGWQHVSQPLPGVQPKAELSAQTPHSGRYCLQLSAEASPLSAAPQIVGRPLVRISSPPVHVAAGDVLEITGWVRVSKPIVGNIDGLTIVDALGGPELAIRVRQSANWQQFRMVRGASESADETITFLLNGLGAASIDDLSIHMLSTPSARRLPSTAPTPPPPTAQSAGLPTLSAPRNQR